MTKIWTLLFSIGLLAAWVAHGFAAEALAGERSGSDCCRQDRADIARLHQNADRLYAQFKPGAAAAELQKILSLEPRNFEALIKMARAHVDIGDLIPEEGPEWKERKVKEYTAAEAYARKAVKVDPQSTWGHFWIAASLGNIAMVAPISRQLELAGEIRDEVEKALALDPKNGPAYHVYGVWHRKVAEIGAAKRLLATVVYSRPLPQGSLEESVELLKRAVALNPATIISRLELARSYIANEDWEPARAMLKSIADLPIQFSDDARNKQKAKQLLAEIDGR
jgi:tetratricopeptide (TPR) repeat protein